MVTKSVVRADSAPEPADGTYAGSSNANRADEKDGDQLTLLRFQPEGRANGRSTDRFLAWRDVLGYGIRTWGTDPGIHH